MNKKLIFFFVITVVVSVFLNVFAGGWISAKISNITFFGRYQILSPQAPIVITRPQDIKSSDSTDMTDSINKVKSRLSSVATIAGNSITVNGNAINLSADGYFLTTQAAIAKDASTQTIILNDGQHAPITQVYGEAGTNLVIVKANLNGVPVTEFASSKGMAQGQKVGFVHSAGSTIGAVYFQESFITTGQNNSAGKVFSSDKPARNFGVQSVGSLVPGETIINLDGKVVGVWDGQSIVSSDVINETIRAFFGSQEKLIERPQWLFTYRNIGSMESGLFQIPLGGLIVSVDPLGPAGKAGLAVGDSITAVAGQNVTEDTSLEELLQQQKPNQVIGITVVRNKKLMTINITPSN